MACSSAPWAAPTHIAALPHLSWLMWASRVLSPELSAGSPMHEHVGGLDPHPVERELRLGAAAKAHLLVGARDAHAVGGEVDDDRPDPLAASLFAPWEPAPDQARDGPVPTRHVVLVGLEPPAVAVGRRAWRASVWRQIRHRAP